MALKTLAHINDLAKENCFRNSHCMNNKSTCGENSLVKFSSYIIQYYKRIADSKLPYKIVWWKNMKTTCAFPCNQKYASLNIRFHLILPQFLPKTHKHLHTHSTIPPYCFSHIFSIPFSVAFASFSSSISHALASLFVSDAPHFTLIYPNARKISMQNKLDKNTCRVYSISI